MFGRRNTGNIVPFSNERPSPSTVQRSDAVSVAVASALPLVQERLSQEDIATVPRHELAKRISAILDELAESGMPALNPPDKRNAVTDLMNEYLLASAPLDKPAKEVEAPPTTEAPPAEFVPSFELTDEVQSTKPPRAATPVEAAKSRIQPLLMQHIDIAKASELPRDELASQVGDVVSDILGEEKMRLNLIEQRDLVTLLLNDMLGLGPLEPLLEDEAVTDIMVNGANQVYVERRGKLELTGIRFRDEAHLNNVCARIVSYVGRRVDESTPLVDCRLPDGSRVNIIIPPLAIDGATISIRKFAKKKITLDAMEQNGNLSPQMAQVLRIAARSRLNIVISGGTGSGKTTLLNALSRMIDDGERIVTIEDAAELQLQQPHVVRLETRPANLEGEGEITQRELVKNALRMRPDRVILGEIRSGEALDMLQAMNTGHDGSMCTLHANRPREALTRLENMVAMAGVKLPNEAVRAQIAGAVNMVLQIARMRDGVRRISHITEVVGMEGEVVTTQDLFTFEFEGEDENGKLVGSYKSTGLRPNFLTRAQYFGLDRALMDAMG